MISLEKKHINISIGVAVTIVLFLIVMTMNFATWKAEMTAEHKTFTGAQDHMEEGLQTLKNRMYNLEAENTDFKVQLATIETKLVSIESLLIEIREDLRTHSE